jgi:hypothetical protein
MRNVVLGAGAGVACGMLAASGALAAVDGTIAPGEYPTVLGVQTTGTGFGNNESELNACFAGMGVGGVLRVGLTGNLQDNGNAFVVFLDTRPGGCVETVLPGGFGQTGSFGGQAVDDWGTDVDGGPDVWPTPGGGSVLPAWFNPDLAIAFSRAGSTYYVNVIDMTAANDTTNPMVDRYFGSNEITENLGASLLMANPLGPGSITSAFSPASNAAGVNGLGDVPGDPLSATFGLEFEVSPEVLGLQGGQIRLMAFITNGGGDYLSNQFLPPLGPEAGNLGPAGDPVLGEPLFDARQHPGLGFMNLIVTCPADIDDGTSTGTPGGGVDITDLLYFLREFELGNIAAADLDNGSGTGTPDGGVDVNDLLYFLSHFEQGC